MMKKFILRTLLFLTIPILYAGIGELYLSNLKETTSIEEVTDIQKNSPKELYYGRQILGNSLSNYKLTMFQKKQPNIITLGQSITLQFRDFMFEPYEGEFYNTGLMVRNIVDLEYVVTKFEENELRKPKFILLGTDLSFVLKTSILDKQEFTRTPPIDRATESRSHLKGIQNLYLSAKLRRAPSNDLGFGKSGMEGRGYRRDGSYRHKPEIEKYAETKEYHDGNLINKLHSQQSPFLMPMEYESAKEDRFLLVLKRFRALDIDLLLYFPPYSDEFFNQAKQNIQFMHFWKKYISFQSKLIDLDYDVIPFTTPSNLGLTDDYMVDAEHPSEVMSAIQLYKYCKNANPMNATLDQLTFEKLEMLFNDPNTFPISFLVDSVSQPIKNNLKKEIWVQ